MKPLFFVTFTIVYFIVFNSKALSFEKEQTMETKMNFNFLK